MTEKIYTFDPKKRKKVLVGELVGDTLFKKLVKSKHFMRVVDGYGIQEMAMVDLVRRGAKEIVITEQDTLRSWRSKVVDWINHGKVADYGNGKQRFLSLKYMRSKQKEHQYEIK